MGITAAVAAVASVGYSVYSGERAASAQKDAQNQAQQQAQQQEQQAQQQADQAKATADAQTKQLQDQTASYQQQAKVAQDQLTAAQQSFNRTNQKTPDSKGLLQAAAGAKGGQSGTMLTGPSGVDSSALSLGKNTLLGQ